VSCIRLLLSDGGSHASMSHLRWLAVHAYLYHRFSVYVFVGITRGECAG
jgi:hypothetical protein